MTATRQAGRHGAGAICLPYRAGREERLGLLAWTLETSQPTHSIASPKATSPNPSKTVPPARDQTFNYVSQWGPFSFKPSEYKNFIA